MDVLILYIMAVMLIDPAGIMPFQCQNPWLSWPVGAVRLFRI